MHPVRLSAIVITKNEGANIAACLDSLEFCDERIIIDSGSNDDTVRLAQSKGARVTNHNWQGFGAQKNFALSLATGDWVAVAWSKTQFGLPTVPGFTFTRA